MISLLDKVVRVSSEDILMFFFPDFKVRRVLTPIDYGSKIIYTGPLNKKAQDILQSGTYIATRGLYQYDLTNRKQMIQFVFSKYDREVPDYIMRNIDLYDDDEFLYCCKIYWMSHQWPYKPESEDSVYSLYQASVSSTIDFLKKYYKCTEFYKIPILEQSFFTFILRAKSVDEQNVSPMYKRLLKVFYNTSNSRVKPAMLQYIESPISDRELRFVEFIFSLRKRDV